MISRVAISGLPYSLTIRRPDQLEVVWVRFGESFDDVDLHQGHLHRVHVLGAAGGVGNPQLTRGETKQILAKSKINISDDGAMEGWIKSVIKHVLSKVTFD